ncbi:hypothetical protein MML48_6g00016021 [Holotrichia oblita]|uniref:Uncharacterized protein n=1 Tax=Holotrichia oblita TaxID=644536 RepID=A0ACB9SY38_HOLOL|nr:hypothetical protein MML48_6g00016021 [Holotrichia oblita]
MEAIEQENEEFTATPPEIREQAIKATDNLLPEKSRIQYEQAYNLFSKWCSEKQIKIYSENVLVAYFQQHSENILPEASKPLLGKIKSNGTDDGFKGEAAQCGSSVIRVAHQMVTGKFTKGTVTSEEEFATEPANFNRALRRGSKSLPSSPLTSPNTSPKAKRKQMNRYFSGSSDVERAHGSWILSGLLRKHDQLSRSVSVINEEENVQDSLTKTVSQISIDESTEAKVPKQKKAKPSELREMNFWSPTSM